MLFFQPSEDSIKLLFHSQHDLTRPSLIWFTVIYFFLACWTYGIAVPSGLFVPSLLIGASVGRLYGVSRHELLASGLHSSQDGSDIVAQAPCPRRSRTPSSWCLRGVRPSK